MYTETVSYSLLSSALGIIIVFVALVALSLLMVLLKKVFDRTPVPRPAEPVPAKVEQTIEEEEEDLLWLTTATAVYLLEEEEELNAPSAAGWLSGPEARTDPWGGAPILRTTVERSTT